MARRRTYPVDALGALCPALVACFLPIGAEGASSAAYSVAIEWADARTAKGGDTSLMAHEISIAAKTIKISDMFAWAVWAANDEPGDPVALIINGNETKCISYKNTKPKLPGDYQFCGKASLDGNNLRTLDLMSEWKRKEIPKYYLKIHTVYTLETTSSECKVRLISASRNYDDKPNEAVQSTRTVKEECRLKP